MSILLTPKLDLLWPALLSTQKSLLQRFREPLAAPFWSAASENYLGYKLRFMLVGRATRGPYDPDDFLRQLRKSSSDALIERKALNRHCVEQITKRSPFWRSFVAGSRCCGADNFDNAVWSNLTKIGFANGDVNADLFHAQEELAENTLRAELETYRPTVVHFAVGTLGGECIYRATGTNRSDWGTLAKDGPLSDIWFLNSGSLKAIWTRHPNRAKKELVDAWTTKLRSLIEVSETF